MDVPPPPGFFADKPPSKRDGGGGSASSGHPIIKGLLIVGGIFAVATVVSSVADTAREVRRTVRGGG